MRARNAAAASPDAAGALPDGPAIDPQGRAFLPTSLPVHHLAWRLRRIGVPAYVSRDAGAYLCNWLLYHSLACPPRPGRRVGFIHVPASLARPGARGCAGPLTWQQAIAGGLEILAACLGQRLAVAARRARLAGPALMQEQGREGAHAWRPRGQEPAAGPGNAGQQCTASPRETHDRLRQARSVKPLPGAQGAP
jgi:pyroglutamyl-peptidase